MNNAILIQQAYTVGGFDALLELTKTRNEVYCALHNFDFLCTVEDGDRPSSMGAWQKVALIKDAMLKGYEYIIWLDADALIYDTAADLREACEIDKIGACWHRIPQLHHWNVGVLYIHNSPETRTFIDAWSNSYPPPNDGWYEQGVFNGMAKMTNTVVTVSDKWNATINVNMVPDAVVIGYHGQGSAKNRLEMMTRTLETLNQKAQQSG